MEREVFSEWARHFIAQLGTGEWTEHGPGGFSVLLLLDGHASHWSYEVLEYLRVNNVYCLISPPHASIWAQDNDAGVNASFSRAGFAR